MITDIRDRTYRELSGFAYDIKPRKSYIINYEDGKEKWTVIHNKKFKIHDVDTGFDALVVKNEKNIVIAYRGTEANSIENVKQGRAWPDVKTDYTYIVRGKTVDRLGLNIEYDNGELSVDFHEKNQFRQGDKLVQDVKKEYPDHNIKLTGHSLAGSVASYAAAKNNVEAVTFNGPSVINLLPKDLKEKAVKGEFDKQIVNYIHPKDSISSGAVNPYKRYIGSAYYIGSSFDLANSKNRYNPVSRAWGSLAGEGYHAMKHFKFDSVGNLDNPILTNVLTGQSLAQSPRYTSGEMATINVMPEHLINLASELEGYVSRVEELCSSFKRDATMLDGIQISEGVVNEVIGQAHNLSSWFAEDTSRMANNLNAAAASFVEADVLK
ncbi:lipase family protein [Priestia aryabhattai]|uniref:lipase family protein n=1 Tax=Priestia aryabhattai TaxID=412384 RepID=UPI001C8EFF67|nr:hypothetical protein [Priestia aryabhattai]MBY0062071.1 hypothetical protein [Priestia aryabhattai]